MEKRYMSYDPTGNFREQDGTLDEAIERACRVGLQVYTSRKTSPNGRCEIIADCISGTPRWYSKPA
jgi:hypothetical protein